MTDYVEVTTTTADEESAQRIARGLVDRRLAACVQVSGPITSTYRWQEKIATDTEWRCTAKTKRSLLSEVERTIAELHPYEVPEMLAVPIVGGGRDYLAWLAAELRDDEP